MLAKGSQDTKVIVGDHKLDTIIHDDLQVLAGHPGSVTSVEWSPDGLMFASGSMCQRANSQKGTTDFAEATVRIWDTRTWKLHATSKGYESTIWSVAWSGDGQTLVTGCEDKTVRLWTTETGALRKTLKGHSDMVRWVRWSPDGRTIASASDDDTIRFWDSATGRSMAVLDEHTQAITSISFSADARLLATKSDDSTVRIWRCDTKEVVAIIDEPRATDLPLLAAIAFHPTEPVLATLGENDSVIRIWKLDIPTLLDSDKKTTHCPPDVGKEVTSPVITEVQKDFDVFLAHNSQDKPLVDQICKELKLRGLNPWLDNEQIPPGKWFQDVIQQAIPRVKSFAIIIGPHGLGRWQLVELRTFISQCVESGIPVIPVLLSGTKGLPTELLFLRELNAVRFDYGIDDPVAMDKLEWGITGRHPKDKHS